MTAFRRCVRMIWANGGKSTDRDLAFRLRNGFAARNPAAVRGDCVEQKEGLTFFGYQLAYFDTNVFSALVKKPASWPIVRTLFVQNNLLLGVSDVNYLELSDVPGLHRDLAFFLLKTPSAFFKPATQMIEEEIKAYLAGEEVDPLVGPISTLLLESDDPVGTLEAFFREQVITDIRSAMVERKPAFVDRIEDTLRNFQPVVHPERFTEEDGPYYAYQSIVSQILMPDWPECAQRVLEQLKQVPRSTPSLPPQFRGLWLFGLVQFYRYFLHRRTPVGEDYGDLLHALLIPYCRLVVVERSLSDDLSHIKGQDPVLQATEIHHLGFLRELTGLRLGG